MPLLFQVRMAARINNICARFRIARRSDAICHDFLPVITIASVALDEIDTIPVTTAHSRKAIVDVAATHALLSCLLIQLLGGLEANFAIARILLQSVHARRRFRGLQRHSLIENNDVSKFHLERRTRKREECSLAATSVTPSGGTFSTTKSTGGPVPVPLGREGSRVAVRSASRVTAEKRSLPGTGPQPCDQIISCSEALDTRSGRHGEDLSAKRRAVAARVVIAAAAAMPSQKYPRAVPILYPILPWRLVRGPPSSPLL